MDSPLLQPRPTPRKVVEGTHISTAIRGMWGEARFTIDRLHEDHDPRGVVVYFGDIISSRKTYLTPALLREFSTLFAELADALEGK